MVMGKVKNNLVYNFLNCGSSFLESCLDCIYYNIIHLWHVITNFKYHDIDSMEIKDIYQ